MPGAPRAAERLTVLRRDLDAILGPVEATFLGAGEQLGSAVVALHAVTDSFDGLAGMVASDDLDATTRSLAGIPEILALAAEANSRGNAALQRLDDLAQGLDRPLARLRKTMGEVNVLAINGRIEAAHVTSAGTDFSVFTRDMGALAAQAMAALERLAGELEALNRLTAEARNSQGSMALHEGDTLAEVARRLRLNVETMARRRRETAEAARRIGELSRVNGQSVGQAIGALQIGDIARQRIEHVVAALTDPDPDRVGPLCRLQALQLGHTGDELSREVERARVTFAKLMDDAAAMQAQGSIGFGSGSGGSGAFLEDLASDLRTALAPMARYHDIAGDLQTRLVPISRTVADMVAHVETVRSIEADMRIMGLNATLKCGRLGVDGRALGVIAQALRAQAGHTAESAGQVMVALEEIFTVAQGLNGNGSADADQAVATLTSAVAVFDRGGEAMTRALGILGREGEAAIGALSRVRQSFDLAATLAGIGACVSALHRLADDLGAPQGHGDLVADLSDSYTMASQREIHARFNGQETRSEAKAGPASVDDFLF